MFDIFICLNTSIFKQGVIVNNRLAILIKYVKSIFFTFIKKKTKQLKIKIRLFYKGSAHIYNNTAQLYNWLQIFRNRIYFSHNESKKQNKKQNKNTHKLR